MTGEGTWSSSRDESGLGVDTSTKGDTLRLDVGADDALDVLGRELLDLLAERPGADRQWVMPPDAADELRGVAGPADEGDRLRPEPLRTPLDNAHEIASPGAGRADADLSAKVAARFVE